MAAGGSFMTDTPYSTALIVGAGQGISAAVARKFAAAGLKVALVARNADKLAGLAGEIGALALAADATDAPAVADVFEKVSRQIGTPDVVVYNASARAHGPIAELDPETVRNAIAVSAFGGFLVTREAA